MRFSTDRQPRHAVYVVRHKMTAQNTFVVEHILVARYATLARALVSLATELESGELAYHDVN